MGSKRPPANFGVNEALRKAGFVPLPRWWVTQDELSAIHRMAHNHESEITRIRLETRRRNKEKTRER
jgi:hypothetical protein